MQRNQRDTKARITLKYTHFDIYSLFKSLIMNKNLFFQLSPSSAHYISYAISTFSCRYKIPKAFHFTAFESDFSIIKIVLS